MKRLFFYIIAVFILSACQQAGPVDLNALAGKARAGDATACRELVKLLAMEKNKVSDKVYPLIVEIGKPMIEPLMKEVRSDNRGQREMVIAALGTLRVKSAVKPISEVLAVKQLKRRYIAAWALGEIGDESSIRSLLIALGDPEELVRQYATRSLIKFNRSAVEPLLDYLPQADQVAAAGVVRVLGDIGDPRSIDALLGQVEGPNRREVFLALGKLRDPRTETVLIRGLDDADWRARMNAAMALGPIGSSASISPLRATLDDEVMVVREWSARSLSVITGSKVKYRDAAGKLIESYSVYH